jgi:hypothetical protein
MTDLTITKLTIEQSKKTGKWAPEKTLPVVDVAAKLDISSSPAENSWRLVHDSKKTIALFESSGFTWTRNTLFCAKTEQECQDEIKRLWLESLAAEGQILQ